MLMTTNQYIESVGISSCLPKKPKYFTEFCLYETFNIPIDNPNIDELLSIIMSMDVLSVRVINTPIALSAEGEKLSGCKLVIELKINQKIKYVAEGMNKTVHSAHFENTLKNVFVTAPYDMNKDFIENLIKQKKIIVTPYIEDIYAELINNRNLFRSVNALINIQFYEN